MGCCKIPVGSCRPSDGSKAQPSISCCWDAAHKILRTKPRTQSSPQGCVVMATPSIGEEAFDFPTPRLLGWELCPQSGQLLLDCMSFTCNRQHPARAFNPWPQNPFSQRDRCVSRVLLPFRLVPVAASPRVSPLQSVAAISPGLLHTPRLQADATRLRFLLEKH